MGTNKFFELPNVNYRGEKCKYKISKFLSAPLYLESFPEFYNQAKQKGDPYPANSILTFSIFDAISNSKNKKLKEFLHSAFGSCINTFSRVLYRRSGDDEVVHNFGTEDSFSLKGNLVNAKNCFVSEVNDANVLNPLELILGIKDIKKIDKIFDRIDYGRMILNISRLPEFKYSDEENGERNIVFTRLGSWHTLDTCRNYFAPALLVQRVD